MKVSIIIPVYNVAPYIYECIDSVFKQTYSNIEVIIVDDCSTDNSMNIIKEYVNSLPSKNNIYIIKHKYNKGLSAARNTGIKHSTGDYIYFIDSDDYISSNCIESFVHVAKKNKKIDIIFGHGKCVPFKWKNFIYSTYSENLPQYVYKKKHICKLFFSKEQFLPTTAWNKLIRKKYVTFNNLYFKEGIIHEDELLHWNIGNTVKSIAFNKCITYFYRYVPNSIINKVYNKTNMDSEVIIIKEMAQSITHRYFIYKCIYILHFSHSSYCRRQGDKPLPPAYIRYPKAFWFFIKCLFMKPEKLR